MRPTVYIETTIVSYLTARPSRDLLRAAQQRSTIEWWTDERQHFEVVCSELVHLEASSGDPTAAAERLKVLANLTNLRVEQPAIDIAEQLIDVKAIPPNADRDALHVGICASNGIDYLLTWNFKHLANAVLRDRITQVCEGCGYAAPVICTPDELEYLP